MANTDNLCVCDNCQRVYPIRVVTVHIKYGRSKARNIIFCPDCEAAHLVKKSKGYVGPEAREL